MAGRLIDQIGTSGVHLDAGYASLDIYLDERFPQGYSTLRRYRRISGTFDEATVVKYGTSKLEAGLTLSGSRDIVLAEHRPANAARYGHQGARRRRETRDDADSICQSIERGNPTGHCRSARRAGKCSGSCASACERVAARAASGGRGAAWNISSRAHRSGETASRQSGCSARRRDRNRSR